MLLQIPVNYKCNHTVALAVGKMLLLNVLGWEATVDFSITVTDDGEFSSEEVLPAVECCEAALPSGHCAIAVLSLCLKSEEIPMNF